MDLEFPAPRSVASGRELPRRPAAVAGVAAVVLVTAETSAPGRTQSITGCCHRLFSTVMI